MWCVQIFDAIIIIASFVLDVVFLDGVTEVSEGEQAAALIMVFLLWRILRIVNGERLLHFKRPAVDSYCSSPNSRNQTLNLI